MSILHTAKTLAAAIGVATPLVTAWTFAGLPVPATQTYVAAQLNSVRKDISLVNVGVLETRLTSLGLAKNALILEQHALEKALTDENNTATRATFERRQENIKSEIERISRQEQRIEIQIDGLRSSNA